MLMFYIFKMKVKRGLSFIICFKYTYSEENEKRQWCLMSLRFIVMRVRVA